MTVALDISIKKAERSKLQDINLENIPFGKYFTDHMLEANYENGQWASVEIKPYQPLLMDPSLAALHYGQAIFEGIKVAPARPRHAGVSRQRPSLAALGTALQALRGFIP